MRSIITFVPFILIFVGLANFAFGNFFGGFLWIVAAFLLGAALWPVAKKSNEKNVPVFQVFFAPILFLAAFCSALVLDFAQAQFSIPESIIFGIVGGFLMLAIIMILKGK